ncbi:MAG: hypothetical protein ABJA11_03180 [Pseudolysinimonas sp.]
MKRVGTAAAVAALLVLLAGCASTPDRGNAHPQRWPLGLPASVVQGCEQSVGLGDSAVAATFYRDSEGVHVRIGHADGRGNGIAIGSGGGMSNTESALLSCLTVASGPPEAYPTDTAGLLLLWRYSTSVLWPCLAQHGVDPGPSPSRADIVGGDPLRINPYARLYSRISDERLQQLRRDCPAVPPYLIPTAG